MLDTNRIQEIASSLIPSFDGVYPINDLPANHKKTYKMIVNTDPDNLPGQHWIAVLVREGNEGFVFDSFGYPPPLELQHWLNLRKIRWTSNSRRVQSENSLLCGHFCIYFLWFATANTLCNEHFNNIMNILFPLNSYYPNYYDNIVRDFVTLFKI